MSVMNQRVRVVGIGNIRRRTNVRRGDLGPSCIAELQGKCCKKEDKHQQ
jgi:hypothetical protein